MKRNNQFKNIVLALLTLTFLNSCTTTFDEINYNNGNADFTRFVAIGSSFMAGYSDNALYLEAQSNSIPAIIASRFTVAGGGGFLQPLVNPGRGIGMKGNSKYVLRLSPDPCSTDLTITANAEYASGDISNYTAISSAIPFNNVAVPGARIRDLGSQTYGDPSLFLGNPLYARFASNPSTSTITGDALLLNPTFTSVLIGIEDIYNYARRGGEESEDTITTPAMFGTIFTDLMSQLTVQNAGSVVGNIPSLNTIPYFTAVPWNGLYLDAATAADLTYQYSTVDPSISFGAGYNAFVIADVNEPSGRRQIQNGEYILLSIPADSIKCYKWGTIIPIPERFIITRAEAVKIENAVVAYNSIIANEAASRGIALADLNALFKTFKQGIVFNGVKLTTGYLDYSVFSSDGFYPNQKGYALIANEFLRAINRTYSSNLPLVDVNSFQGLVFP